MGKSPDMRDAVAAPINSPARVLLASLIGTTIEFFDFYIYATAAALVFGELAHGIRINPFKALQLIRQRKVVLPELIQFGLTHHAIGIQQPGTVTFDVERLLFRRNILLVSVFVFQRHKCLVVADR